MTIVSYAQNREDVVLARAFPPDYEGFYIDVGAWDPIADSVTKLFYDRGWHGINVEPSRSSLAALVADRPRDVNLSLGIGEVEGELPFYELAGDLSGTSTFVSSLAECYREDEVQVTSRQVRVTTLARLCEEHVGDATIDFLKIDIEGGESAALAGADFTRFRPRIVVVEATRPGTPVPSHGEWEPILTGSGYRFVLFDGLNRFYVREEDAALARLLAAPANVFDDYVSYETDRLRASLKSAEEQINLVSADVTKLNGLLSEAWAEKIDLIDEANTAQTAAANARDMVAALRAQLDTARGECDTARQERDTARAERDTARGELNEARATLQLIQQSRLMRLTSAPRRVYYKVRRKG